MITPQQSSFLKNDKYSKGAKHMELKYFVVKEEVQKHKVSIERISTDLMIVDLLTKGLPPKNIYWSCCKYGHYVTSEL